MPACQLVATAWQLSVMPDYSFATTRAERPQGLTQGRGFMRALAPLVHSEPDVQLLINDIFHFVKPLDVMRDPALVSRVFAFDGGSGRPAVPERVFGHG